MTTFIDILRLKAHQIARENFIELPPPKKKMKLEDQKIRGNDQYLDLLMKKDLYYVKQVCHEKWITSSQILRKKDLTLLNSLKSNISAQHNLTTGFLHDVDLENVELERLPRTIVLYIACLRRGIEVYGVTSEARRKGKYVDTNRACIDQGHIIDIKEAKNILHL